MKRKIPLYSLVFVLFVACYALHAKQVNAATIGSADEVLTTVSATVGSSPVTPSPSGGERFAIYGYTSPNAVVNIQSPIYGETRADEVGLFEFKYLFLTLFHEDLCLVAHDTEGRSTPPLCIPPPTTEANKRVGPVILPPSTSISAGNAYIGDSITLTGQTIPNAEVKLSLFTDDGQKNKVLSLIPEAYAYTIPQISLTSNEKGEYSLVLPTASSQFIRMFTRALFDGNSTPKSLTLVLDIFPLWMIIFKFFSSLLSLLKAHLMELIILSQLYFLLMYVLKRFFDPHVISIHRHRELARIHGEMILLSHELVLAQSKYISPMKR